MTSVGLCASQENSLPMNKQAKRVLKLFPLTPKVSEYYRNHGTYHLGDSGLDLFVAETQMIKAGETAFIKLKVKAEAYDENGVNCSFLILPRSSIAKTPLRISNSLGLIDAGYRGELICSVDNIKNFDYEVKEGDRLVQAVYFDGRAFDFEITNTLTTTNRGEGGWGSTSK